MSNRYKKVKANMKNKRLTFRNSNICIGKTYQVKTYTTEYDWLAIGLWTSADKSLLQHVKFFQFVDFPILSVSC